MCVTHLTLQTDGFFDVKIVALGEPTSVHAALFDESAHNLTFLRFGKFSSPVDTCADASADASFVQAVSYVTSDLTVSPTHGRLQNSIRVYLAAGMNYTVAMSTNVYSTFVLQIFPTVWFSVGTNLNFDAPPDGNSSVTCTQASSFRLWRAHQFTLNDPILLIISEGSLYDKSLSLYRGKNTGTSNQAQSPIPCNNRVETKTVGGILVSDFPQGTYTVVAANQVDFDTQPLYSMYIYSGCVIGTTGPGSPSCVATTTGQATTGQATTGQATTGQATTGQATTGQAMQEQTTGADHATVPGSFYLYSAHMFQYHRS